MIAPAHEGSIASLTPTLCMLFGIPPTSVSAVGPLESVRRYSRDQLSSGFIDRCLIYCPDALGDALWSRFPNQVAAIEAHCPLRISLSSVLPPKTPVCFASIFTGASPEVHGIQRLKSRCCHARRYLMSWFAQAGVWPSLPYAAQALT